MASLKSGVWGNVEYPITQGFGVYGGRLADWYGYSSSYGFPSGYHIGVDVGVPKLTKLYAANAGEVIQSGFSSAFRPSPVWIREKDTGNIAIYGHMWENAVSTGQKVQRGQYLGKSGEQTTTGTWNPDGSGPHIHFEYRVPDERYSSAYRAVDPIPVLTGATSTVPGGIGNGSGSIDFPNVSEGMKRIFIGLVSGIAVAIGLAGLGVPIPLPPPLALVKRLGRK